MKKELKAPPKPTTQERQKLENYFYLPNWQFDSLIGNKCTIISSRIIQWTKEDSEYAHIYGLRAVFTDSGKQCFANFFVHYQSQVYQFMEIYEAIAMIELIKKDTLYDEHAAKVWQKKYDERQKKKKSNLLTAA
jgi:hypothetical protein